MKVGDKVYLLPSGEMLRHIKDSVANHIIEATIEKVGRKYVTVMVDKWHTHQFVLNEKYDGGYAERTLYSCDYYMYETKQEILDMLEAKQLKLDISTVFSRYYYKKELTLDQLRRIKQIIDEEGCI